MSRPIPISEWLRALVESMAEVAGSGLRFEEGARELNPPGDAKRPGAYIAIVTEGASLRIGLSATPEGCGMLARALLGLRDGAPLGSQEIADAVCELVNIVAGKVKSRFADRDGSLTLGLPMFAPGPIHAGGVTETASERVRVGPVDCLLQVYRSARESRRAA